MSNISPSITEEWNLSRCLVNKVIANASGAASDECHYNYPRDVFFIGNLRPKGEEDLNLNRRELLRKLSPFAFGVEFRTTNFEGPAFININLQWSCFYRIFPSYKQQRDWSNVLKDKDREVLEVSERKRVDEDETPDETLRGRSASDRANERRPREDLFIRFKKIECFAEGKIQISDNGNYDISQLVNSIAREFERIYQHIQSDKERIRTRGENQLPTLPPEALDSEDNYLKNINAIRNAVQPIWNWEILVDINKTDRQDELSLLIQFVNSSSTDISDKLTEPYLFNPAVELNFDQNIVRPFDLELAPKSFRYNRRLEGKGFNCAVDKISDSTYKTTHTPIYTQSRFKTRAEPAAKFEALAVDPIPILNSIQTEMENYLDVWDKQEKIYSADFGDSWQSLYRTEFIADKNKFIDEINQYKIGLDLIKNDSDILLAFKLANESFKRAGIDSLGNIKKDRWRLFQIVFLVIQIPGMVALKSGNSTEREKVDIIYFPTGGGKTEAYLSVLVFHSFFDRLRGKTAGVTAWIRFPLRLLTIQQTQRLADIIGIAEIIRQEQNDKRLKGKNIHPFSVGYYVGSSSTPNEIPNDRDPSVLSKAQDPEERQAWKRVVTCPSCKTSTITVEFDEVKTKLQHICSQPNCKFQKGILPVYIVDNEIYRFLPTVIVGTIDKLASIGQQRKLSMVFGKVDGYCKDHGFYNSRCCQKSCKDQTKLEPSSPNGISGPTLFLQDELHLLREGLGTFDSHYETFSQVLLREFGNNQPLKIIASSATIEKYERQVEHLYGRAPHLARVFPGPGPSLGQSFYAQTEEYPQRLFVGILPHNKTIFNSLLELIEYYHKEVQELAHLSNSISINGNITSTPEWYKLLDLYSASLTYFLATRDLDSMKTDIESHINNVKLANEGYNQLELLQLTSGTSSDDVTRILQELEAEHAVSDSPQAVLATNMVSHGVDIDRLNAMFFYGFPRSNAEYIQASSRVGRTHIGIVFDCFHPIRERDQSHYAYFKKYHEFLGQMVEPVAINRWSTYGIDRTIPGLFMATILQIFSNRDNGSASRNRYYMIKAISDLFTTGEIDKASVKNILKEAYIAGLNNDSRNNLFEERIDKAVDHFFDSITHPGSSGDFVSEALYPSPMTSLRDVDESIDIQLDFGSQWASLNH
jgi:hypothetical protein